MQLAAVFLEELEAGHGDGKQRRNNQTTRHNSLEKGRVTLVLDDVAEVLTHEVLLTVLSAEEGEVVEGEERKKT